MELRVWKRILTSILYCNMNARFQINLNYATLIFGKSMALQHALQSILDTGVYFPNNNCFCHLDSVTLEDVFLWSAYWTYVLSNCIVKKLGRQKHPFCCVARSNLCVFKTFYALVSAALVPSFRLCSGCRLNCFWHQMCETEEFNISWSNCFTFLKTAIKRIVTKVMWGR